MIVILQTLRGFVCSSSAGAEVWLLPLMVGAALLATAAVSLGFQAGFFVFFFFFSNRAPMIEEEEPEESRALSATMLVTQKVLNGMKFKSFMNKMKYIFRYGKFYEEV